MLSIPWIVGPIVYALGVLLSLSTGNFDKYISDYPWACFSATITIGIWASSYLTERHVRCTNAIREAYLVSDEAFESAFRENLRRLTHPFNLVFGFIFLPSYGP